MARSNRASSPGVRKSHRVGGRFMFVGVFLLLVACTSADQPDSGADQSTTTVSTRPTTTVTSVTSTTAPTTVDPTSQVSEVDVVACLLGEWVLDAEGFRDQVQAVYDPNLNPDFQRILVELVSGGGTLEFRSEMSFAVAYDDLTLRFTYEEESGNDTISETRAHGDAQGTFDVDGATLVTGESSSPGIDIREWLPDLGIEAPRGLHPGAMVLGLEVVPPASPSYLVVDCDGDRLMIHSRSADDEFHDAPSTVWNRR